MHDSANATNAANGSPPRPTIRPFDVPAAGPAPVKPIPDDYPRVVPYLCVTAAGAAIEFYRTVFDATERMRMAEPRKSLAESALNNLKITTRGNELEIHTQVTAASLASLIK